MDTYTKSELIDAVEALVTDISPDAKRVNKYGGVLCVPPGEKDEGAGCGYFVYAKHISVEFSLGHMLTDTHGVLEGKGKYRRHIKLYTAADIVQKHLAEYLRQAFALAASHSV